MKVKTFIAGLDCSVEDAIRIAMKGYKIVVPCEDEEKPRLELINFTEEEATRFFKDITQGIDSARLIIN